MAKAFAYLMVWGAVAMLVASVIALVVTVAVVAGVVAAIVAIVRAVRRRRAEMRVAQDAAEVALLDRLAVQDRQWHAGDVRGTFGNHMPAACAADDCRALTMGLSHGGGIRCADPPERARTLT